MSKEMIETPEITEKDIYWSKCSPTAIIPTKEDTEAGYDVYANFEEDYLVIEPHETKMVSTGIRSAFSPKYAMILEERSSVGKLGIKKNSGVIDSSYRGEWKVLLYNSTDRPFVIVKSAYILPLSLKERNPIIYSYNKAIIQAVMQEIPQVVSHELTEEVFNNLTTKRGTGGFGSSGK